MGNEHWDEAESWESFTAARLDSILGAIRDPVRRFLLGLLATGSTSAGDLAASAANTFGISTSRASQHLQVLARAELVHVYVDGPRRDYALNERGLDEVTAWIADLRLASEADR